MIITGLGVFNNALDPVSRLDITAGACAAYDGGMHELLTGLTKRLDLPFSPGMDGGALDQGAKHPLASYHVWLISDGSSLDALCSGSLWNPVVPEGWTLVHTLAGITTDATGAIRPFWQVDDWVHYATPVLDVGTDTSGGAAPNNRSSSLSTICPWWRPLSVPLGVRCQVDVAYEAGVNSAAGFNPNAAVSSYHLIGNPDHGEMPVPVGNPLVGHTLYRVGYRPGGAWGAVFNPAALFTNIAGAVYTHGNHVGDTCRVATRGYRYLRQVAPPAALKPCSIGLTGTSLTTGANAQGWQREVEAILRAMSPCRRHVDLHDLGARGANSSTFGVPTIGRVARQRLDAVCIEFSINDSLRNSPPVPHPSDGPSLQQAEENTLEMIAAIHTERSDTTIFLMTANPPHPDVAATFPQIADYHQLYRDIVADLANPCVQLIDCAPAYGVPTLAMLPDKVHPAIEALRTLSYPLIVPKLQTIAG